ncbi:MAG: cyclic nucleotide-binding domain-containing protein, partial [Candidatus Sericytochromatia bacterium]
MQKTASSTLSDTELKQALLADGSVSAEQLEALGPMAPEGVIYQIRLQNKCLEIRNSVNGEVLGQVELHAAPETRKQETEAAASWGQDVLLFDPATGLAAGWQKLTDEPAILACGSLSGVSADELASAPHFPATSQLLDTHILRQKSGTGPYDLCLAGKQLLVTDRQAGTLLLVCREGHHPLAQLRVRAPGSIKAINLALDRANEQIYISDNESSRLQLLCLKSFRLSRFQPGLGVLGSIALAHDPRYLFVITIKPSVSIKFLDTQTWEVLKTLPLKGSLFSQAGDLPCELLGRSPDGTLLLVMSYQDDPHPFTPIIQVIDTEAVRVLRRYALKDGQKPGLLATALANPFSQASLGEKLVEAGLVSAEKLESVLFAKPMVQPAAAQELDLSQLRYQTLAADPGHITGDAPPITLPPEAEAEIMDLLVTTFYQQTGIQLENYPAEIHKLQELLPDIRMGLETRYEMLVDVPWLLLGQYRLKTRILREALLTVLELRDSLKQDKIPTLPARCPNCSSPLLGSWDCPTCGFELLSPERALARRLATAEPLSWLLPGQLLLARRDQAEVLLLNHVRQTLWQLDAKSLPLKRPTDAVAMPDGKVLVCDQGTEDTGAADAETGPALLEITPGGEISRLIGLGEHGLRTPLQASFYLEHEQPHYLIADPGSHRVIELNPQGQLVRAYGSADQPGADAGQLNRPVSVQRTVERNWLICDSGNARVLEIDENGKLLRSWGEKAKLKEPVYARLLSDGSLLVVDQGLTQVLNISADKTRAWNYQPAAEGAPRLGALQTVLRQPYGDVVLGDGRTLLQLELRHGQIRWLLDLSTQARPPERAVAGRHSQNPVFARFQLLETLPMLKGATRPALLELAKALTPQAVNPNETVIREGELGTALYLIESGEFEVLRSGHAGHLAVLGPGDILGEMAVVLDEPRSASVRARSAGRLLKLERSRFQDILLRFPEFMAQVRSLALQRRQQLLLRQQDRSLHAIEDLKLRMALSRMRKLPLLAGVSESFFKAVASQLVPVAFKRGQWIFHQGDPGRYLYFISRGRIEIVDEAKDLALAQLPEGSVFGEMAL